MKRRVWFRNFFISVCAGTGWIIQTGCDKEKKPTLIQANGNSIDLDLSNEQYAELRTVGGALRTSVEGIESKVIIIRKSETTASVLSEVCTHAGCPVNLPQNGQILCACHNSLFNLDGSVIQGPAAAPLPSWSTAIENNVIKITV